MIPKAQYSFKVFWKSGLERMVAADRQERIKICEECHNLYFTQYIYVLFGATATIGPEL